MAEVVIEISNELEKIAEIIKKEIHPLKIILFGSRARGDYVKESDFDLLVIVSKEANNRLLAQQIYLLLTKNRIKTSVDVIVESQKKFDSKKENPFIMYHQISKEGITIYEAR